MADAREWRLTEKERPAVEMWHGSDTRAIQRRESMACTAVSAHSAEVRTAAEVKLPAKSRRTQLDTVLRRARVGMESRDRGQERVRDNAMREHNTCLRTEPSLACQVVECVVALYGMWPGTVQCIADQRLPDGDALVIVMPPPHRAVPSCK